ncbi:MAG TPA: 4-hydroxybenzoate octaprenyltransferase [Kiloniellales bacterium]|jgi:4-hydroxybenzoate polyprenyltransferase
MDRPTASASATAASDIAPDSWTLRLAPAAARPYLRLMRIDRPIGTWLLLFPGWWSLSLAAAAEGDWPDWRLAALFAAGALLMRGAGCTYNDLVDRDIDARVARTASRPIPSGEVSPRQAVIFIVVLLVLGLLVLVQMNPFAIALGAGSLALIAVYPFLKRFTYWPQAWLGLTFNWGALLGWAAVTGGLALPPLLLYAAGIAWTLGYDTIYAHQDKEDDALVGVKSTALRFAGATKSWLAFFYGLTVLLLAAVGLAAGMAWPFYAGIAAVAAHFAWQIASLDIDDPGNCLVRFKANRFVGWLLLAGIIAAGQLAM